MNTILSLASEGTRTSLQEYMEESARPLVSMVFVAPLLFVYELGGVVLGPHALRNGADTWLRYLLETLGFGQYFLLPILTCSILLAWHHTRRDAWQLQGGVLTTMLLESTLFAFLLFGLAHLQRALFPPVPLALPGTSLTAEAFATASRLIGYCGAGIYEELLFRLMLLPIVAALFRALGCSGRSSWGWGILTSSLLFSAAHYHMFTAGGYAFDWYTFSFRFAAGLFFAGLFVARGFGIAVGAHAMYDILVEII
ncbi:MAG: CPBP family intramembrane glutamic endopeptidase [Pirellulaceae bacterium]